MAYVIRKREYCYEEGLARGDRKIKLRRGSKIARVAVMRRLTTIFWHMLTYREPYTIGGPPPRLRQQAHAA